MDSALLQISSDPRSEAVFATMAIQLRQEGGFDRVLALLNQLVDDGRKQLHDSTLTFNAVQASCDVSSMKFKERQDFYEQRSTSIGDALHEAELETGNAKDTQTALSAASDFFATFLTTEQARHKEQQELYERRIKNASDAADLVDQAVQSIQNWNTQNPTQAAFVQQKLNAVADAYLQTHSYKIFVPASFLQTAASDDAIKTRILEWLASLKVSFLEASSTFSTVLATRQETWTALESEVAGLIGVYADDVKFLAGVESFLESNRQNLQDAQKLFADLVDKNTSLVAANAKYCGVENANYNLVKSTLEEQLKLFRDIRSYFRNNYSKISGFVKNKYNAPK